ncbi:hypothetical protein D3C72_1390010 [compost metagenome]
MRKSMPAGIVSVSSARKPVIDRASKAATGSRSVRSPPVAVVVVIQLFSIVCARVGRVARVGVHRSVGGNASMKNGLKFQIHMTLQSSIKVAPWKTWVR